MKVILKRHAKFKFKKLVKSFDEIERLFITVNRNAKNLTLESRTKKLGRQILNLLGPKYSSLFIEYEQSVYLAESNCIESAYRLGVEDGKGYKK